MRAVKAHLYRCQFQSQQIGNLARGERVGFVEENRRAVVIGQKIEAALYAKAGLLAFGDVQSRG